MPPSVPPALIAFAVREVEKAILTGRRDAMGGVDHEPGVVTREDVEALRAMAFAPTPRALAARRQSHGRGAVRHRPRDRDRRRTTPNSPTSSPRRSAIIFSGAAFVAAPSRAEALAVEREMDERVGFGGFLNGLAGGLFAPDAADGRKSVDQLAEERYFVENAETEARLEAAAKIDAGEAKWILAHLTRGGELSAAEKRLIAFLRDEASAAPPEIAALFDRAA